MPPSVLIALGVPAGLPQGPALWRCPAAFPAAPQTPCGSPDLSSPFPQPAPGADPPSPGPQPAPVLPRKLPDPSEEQPPPLGGLFAPSPQPAERLQVCAGPSQPPEDVERGAPGAPGRHRVAALRVAAAPAVPARQPHGPRLRRLPGVRRAGPEQEHVRGAPLHLRASVSLGPPSAGTPEGLPAPTAPHASREGHCEATGPEDERRHLAGGFSQEGMGPRHQGETLEALPSCRAAPPYGVGVSPGLNTHSSNTGQC